MFNGTPNGTRTRITGLRGQPPIPVRGWEHMYLKEFAVPLPFYRRTYRYLLTSILGISVFKTSVG